MRRAWILVALLALVGCGGDEPSARAERGPAPTATASETPDARAQAKQEIAELTNDWLAASAREDAEVLCALLVPSERRYFDRVAGDCSTAFAPRGSAKERAFSRRTAAESKGDQIIVYADGYATIEVEHRKDGAYLTLFAIEEDGRWGMARKKRTGYRGPNWGAP